MSRIFAPEPAAASLRLSALVRSLAGLGCDVRVLTTTPGKRASAEVVDDSSVAVRRWPALRDGSGYIRGYLPYLSFDVPLFFRVLFGRAADVYVCEPPPTTGLVLRAAVALRRRPYVYYAADIWSDASASTSAPRFVVSAVRFMEKVALRRASLVLAVTEGVQKRVAELAPAVRSVVVGHGVDLERFKPHGESVAEPADVVYVGTASEWHGAEVAVHALVRVMRSDTTLTAAFVGQGTAWESLQELTAKYGIADRVRFYPPVAPEVAAAWLRSARVSIATLAPGQGYDFAVPTKLYASLAVGTRVVYAGPDPVRSMICDEDLGTATEHDVDALAAGLRSELDRGSMRPDPRLTTWALENVSAKRVAERSVDAIISAVD